MTVADRLFGVVDGTIGRTDDGTWVLFICAHCDLTLREGWATRDTLSDLVQLHLEATHRLDEWQVRTLGADVTEAMRCLQDGAATWLRGFTTNEREN